MSPTRDLDEALRFIRKHAPRKPVSDHATARTAASP
jgi:hypothetical protein